MIIAKDIDFILDCMKWNRYSYNERMDKNISQHPEEIETTNNMRESRQYTLNQMDEVEEKLRELKIWFNLPESINQLNEEIQKIKLILKHFEEDKQGFLKIKKLQKIKISKEGKIRFFKEEDENGNGAD